MFLFVLCVCRYLEGGCFRFVFRICLYVVYSLICEPRVFSFNVLFMKIVIIR